MTPIEQAKAALEFIQHLHSCEDEGMASGQPSKEDYLKAREITDDALSALSTIEGREPVAWHKPGEFPPNPIPEHHILIGYSNRKDKDEDYSLRQLTMHPHKGPWADWYGCVPNPDRWAVIPIPDKHSARWFMPKRAPSLSVDEAVSVKSITLEGEQPDPAGTITVTVQLSDGAEVEAIRTCANNIYHMVTVEGILTERLTKAITRS